jgi:SchA/CurD like domain
MSEFWAVMWDVKPGTEQAVEELFANYGRPDPVVRAEDGSEQGRLLGTQVFMRNSTVVRVMEFEGDRMAIVRHLQRQPVVRELEAKLDQYLATPRDMSTPEGAQTFFRESGMRCLLARGREE